MGAEWITQYAKTFNGSHYLWGSAGATPGVQDGAWYRPGSVGFEQSSTDLERPSIFAANCDVDGHFVCAGNFTQLSGGGYAYSGETRLTTYLDALRKLPSPGAWSAYDLRFTPRVVKGTNLVPNNNGRVVWGEDCRLARHFDCIGFINFVLSLTTSERWNFSIPQYASGKVTPAPPVALNSPPADGDIVIRGNQHIGFLAADGAVVQAQDHQSGVHSDETFAASKWTGRFRVPASIINEPGTTTWGAGGRNMKNAWL